MIACFFCGDTEHKALDCFHRPRWKEETADLLERNRREQDDKAVGVSVYELALICPCGNRAFFVDVGGRVACTNCGSVAVLTSYGTIIWNLNKKAGRL